MIIIKGKKCLITGAASGIGKATAILFAKEGAQLFLTDIHQDTLEETVSEIETQGGIVSKYKAFDIRDFQEVKAFSDEIHQDYGAMDIIMNIAGIAIWGAVDKMKHEEWKKVIDVNLMGPIHVIESFVPEMIKQRNGHIVNVSSAAGLFPLPWHGAYSASKYGLRGLSDVLRYDLKKYHIRTHLVCPGAVDTGLVKTIQISGLEISPEKFQKLKNQFAKYAVSPEQAAQAILKGIQDNDYLIFTSSDIRWGLWGSRLFSPGYNLVMQKLNDFFQSTLSKD